MDRNLAEGLRKRSLFVMIHEILACGPHFRAKSEVDGKNDGYLLSVPWNILTTALSTKMSTPVGVKTFILSYTWTISPSNLL
mmetsp:Transcript_31138/g.75940  ORF Transcript_31138/g.75940 Transcript_31138/m.75940 type:complete len:82 (-) Transcript_31138:1151-1396(-)